MEKSYRLRLKDKHIVAKRLWNTEGTYSFWFNQNDVSFDMLEELPKTIVLIRVREFIDTEDGLGEFIQKLDLNSFSDNELNAMAKAVNDINK
jgi:hypothetical protein